MGGGCSWVLGMPSRRGTLKEHKCTEHRSCWLLRGLNGTPSKTRREEHSFVQMRDADAGVGLSCVLISLTCSRSFLSARFPPFGVSLVRVFAHAPCPW
eukprot:4124482-Prymnesium_polylepis.2